MIEKFGVERRPLANGMPRLTCLRRVPLQAPPPRTYKLDSNKGNDKKRYNSEQHILFEGSF